MTTSHVIVALDIETTGKYFLPQPATGARDDIVAIGMCVYDSSVRGGAPLHRILIHHNVGKPPQVSWRDLWAVRGYEQRCYDEFWHKNEALLDATQTMQKPDDVDFYNAAMSRRELAEKLDSVVKWIETSWSDVSYASDTVTYDIVWLLALLQEHGYDSLSHDREGAFRHGGFHVGSYELGFLGKRRKDDADRARIKKLREAYPAKVEHTHRADQDAATIGRNLVAVMQAADKSSSPQ